MSVCVGDAGRDVIIGFREGICILLVLGGAEWLLVCGWGSLCMLLGLLVAW